MTISITQCVLIGLWTAFCLAGMLFGIYTNRCLIMSAGVGLILGDLPTGLAMGLSVSLHLWDSAYLRADLFRQTQWVLVLWEPLWQSL